MENEINSSEKPQQDNDVIQKKENIQPKRKNLKKNYIYNIMYEIFLLIVPLIVTPYISRVLTANGVGQYSFSFSLISYFTIFGAMGFNTYAQREIAKHQGDKSKQSIIFWEINICRLIPVLLSLILNIMLCCFKVYGDYNNLMLVFSVNILALAFDISFFYQGNEEFGLLALRSVIIKLVSIICIFVFVKDTSDIGIYALINSLTIIISNGTLWLSIWKFIKKISLNSLQPLKHLKGTIRLFIPTIATSIYTVLDKTLIGVLISDTYVIIENGVEVIKRYSDLENGYYEQSEKLIKMAMTIITCIGTVMAPRNSREIALGNLDKVKENVTRSSKVVFLIGLPMVLGFVAIASNLVPWFYGDGYEKCVLLIAILSPLIIIIGFSNVFGRQYLVPLGKDWHFTIALVSGAIINIILNLFLIKYYWSYGAAIATVCAELVVTLIMGVMVHKDINLFKILINSWKIIISSIIMFIIVFCFSKKIPSSIISTLLLVLVGIVVYGLLLVLLREEIILKNIRKFIRKKGDV